MIIPSESPATEFSNVIQPSEEITIVTTPEETVSIVEESIAVEESPSSEIMVSTNKESAEPSSRAPEETTKAEIVQNPPREFQSFAISSPGLQKSIFDLGFETLLNALQSETLSPAQIISKIQEWSLESKNLLEFVHKWQEKAQPRTELPDNSEKEELISELQNTLKETEDKLTEILKSSREM
jgi:hypothetical protein